MPTTYKDYTMNLPGDINTGNREYTVLKDLIDKNGKKGLIRFYDYRDYDTFIDCLAALDGVNDVDVLIPDEVTISVSLTIPQNIRFVFIHSGKFTIGSGVVITNGVRLGNDPNHQIISCNLADRPTIISNFYRSVWFGGGTDDYFKLGDISVVGIKILLTTDGEVKVEKYVGGVLTDSTVIMGSL